MNKQKRISTLLIIIIIVGLIVVVGAGLFIYQYLAMQQAEPTTCTKEAKVCPDGSIVSRAGPNCEFLECPVYPADWKTYRNNDYGYLLKYPSDFMLTTVTPDYVEIISSATTVPFFCYIQVSNNTENLTAQDYANKISTTDSSILVKNKVIENITVGGINAVKVTADVLPSEANLSDPNYIERNITNIYIVKDKKLYTLKVYNKIGETQHDQESFNKILSTFRFIK